MADVPISALPSAAAGPLGDDDLLATVQSGVTVRATGAQVGGLADPYTQTAIAGRPALPAWFAAVDAGVDALRQRRGTQQAAHDQNGGGAKRSHGRSLAGGVKESAAV